MLDWRLKEIASDEADKLTVGQVVGVERKRQGYNFRIGVSMQRVFDTNGGVAPGVIAVEHDEHRGDFPQNSML